jgi:hypothetical protein
VRRPIYAKRQKHNQFYFGDGPTSAGIADLIGKAAAP